MLTKNQKECLEKAKRYSRNSYMNWWFRKYYFNFCNEGYISPDRFLNLVAGHPELETLPKNIQPRITFNEYIKRYEDLYLGKRRKAQA